jgi:hypothetical protein
MQNSVIKGFLSFFVSFGRFLLLALICATLGFVVVWPLWYFAVKFPNVYSFVVLIVAILLAVFFISRKFIKTLKQKTTEEKKSYLFNIFRSFFLCFICLLGLVISVLLILNQMRFLGISIFVVFAIIFGVCVIVIKKK